jgi:2,3-bisphosphoglycerate-dependent phosphoglycerate mutase
MKDSRLVLVRHGQSQFNLENRFTGWMDVPLTNQGEEEARQVGKILAAKHFKPDLAFTSGLKRAQRTLEILSQEIKWSGPIRSDTALNERHYGDLQGKNKSETAKEFGEDQVLIWRRSFDVPPPKGESLKDTAARTLPYFRTEIWPELKAGKNVLVVAHGNSLRSIIMELERMTPEQILKTELKTGEVWSYNLDSKREEWVL